MPTLKPGTRVQSHFRATWTGTIIAVGYEAERRPGANAGVWLSPEGKSVAPYTKPSYWVPAHCALVHVEVDQHGNPIRKPFLKVLDLSYLTPISG